MAASESDEEAKKKKKEEEPRARHAFSRSGGGIEIMQLYDSV